MKKLTRQQAINEKCKDCIYDPKSGLGTWRQQVEGCTMTDCALFAFRPRAYKRKESTGVQPEALRIYSENLRKTTAEK